MNIFYVLMMVAATLATLNSTGSEAKAQDTNLRNIADTAAINSINNVKIEIASKRKLRGADIDVEKTKVHYHRPDGTGTPFLEVRLKRALSNPKKTRKLYDHWYKSGFTPKQLATGLILGGTRELDEIYRRVSKGYAVYVKEKDYHQQTM